MSSVEGNTLPEGWKTVKLNEIGSFHRGITYKKPQLLESYEEGCITLLRANNIQNGLYLDDFQYLPNGFVKDEKLTKSGDVFLAMSSGSKHLVGKNAVLPSLSNHTFGAFCSVYRLDQVEQSPFVSIFFQSHYYKKIISNLFRGAGINNLRSSDLDEVSIPLPSLEEQKRIVAKIDGLFAKIDKAISLTEESLKQAKNLLPSVLKEVFEKGKADGWEERKLGEVFKLTSGKFLPKRKLINGKHKVYGGNGITALHNDYFIEDETIVIGRVGEYCGATHIVDKKSWVTDNGLYCKEFFLDVNLGFLKSILTNMNLNQYAKTSGQPSISQTTVHNISVPIPSIKRQKEIENYFASMDKLNEQSKSKLEEQLAYLKQLKSSILSKAFKGEL